MEEIWKDIPGYEGYYKISNLGRVKSLSRYANTLNGSKRLKKESFLSSKNRKRYCIITLQKDGKREYMTLHRLLAKIFIPNPNNLPQINHINGIKNDNRLENLEWTDQSGNTSHAYKLGLINHRRGEDFDNSKLTDRDVVEIRDIYINGQCSQRDLAKKYNVSQSLIMKVLQRKIWKHI